MPYAGNSSEWKIPATPACFAELANSLPSLGNCEPSESSLLEPIFPAKPFNFKPKTTDPEDNDEPDKKSDTADSSSGNNMAIFGGIGAVALVGLVIFIVLRIRNSDLDEWGEEDLDMNPELQTDRISKPLPVGVALDEFEDKTIVDETPDRPDFITEFDDDDDYVETLESDEEEYEQEESEESEEEYQDDSDDESGITVDENGTEWYEDEVGVWWYRDEGQEDWSEFVE